MREVSEMCSPKRYPIEVTMTAQTRDPTKNISEVIFASVFASPATVGMNAFIEGVIFPKKSQSMPLSSNVLWRAECIFLNFFSSSMKSFCARGSPYFLMRRNVVMFPNVFPIVPMIIVGAKARCPVLTK